MDNPNRNVNFDLSAREMISGEVDKVTASLAGMRDMALQAQAALSGIGSVNQNGVPRSISGGTAAGGSTASTRAPRTPADAQAAAQKAQMAAQRLQQQQQRLNLADDRLIQQAQRQATAQEALQARAAKKVAQDAKLAQQAQTNQSKFAKLNQKGGSFLFGILEYQLLQSVTQGVGAFFDEIDRSVDAAAKMDRFKRSFTNLLGPSGIADLNQVKSFARGTPFSLEESVGLAQRFVAVGFQWNSVIPTMNAAANSIARLGKGNEELDRLVLALTQVQTRGHLAGNEIKQMSEVGVDALSILSSTTGKTTAELQDMVTAGQISAATFLDSFRRWDAANGDFLKAQSEDYLGIQQNLEDVRFEMEAAFGDAAMNKRKAAAKGLLDTLQAPGMKTVAKDYGNALGSIQGSWDALWKNVAQGLAHLDYLNSKAEGYQGTEYDFLMQGYSAQTVAADAADAATTRAIAAAQKEVDAIQAKIDMYTKQNDLLKQAVSLEDELAGIGEAQFNLNRDRRLSLAVYTSEGRSAGQRIQSDQETLAKRMRDYAVNTQIVSNTAQITIQTANLDIANAGLTAAQNGAVPATAPINMNGINPYNLIHDTGSHIPGMGSSIIGNTLPWTQQTQPSMWDYLMANVQHQYSPGQSSGYVPGRAGGGPVSEGWYKVGERGPEWLHAGGNGSVVANGGMTVTHRCPDCDQDWWIEQAGTPRGSRAVGQAAGRR